VTFFEKAISEMAADESRDAGDETMLGMRVENPLDNLFAITDLIERRERTAKPIPGLPSLINDVLHIT
jgi:hypothetical protein